MPQLFNGDMESIELHCCLRIRQLSELSLWSRVRMAWGFSAAAVIRSVYPPGSWLWCRFELAVSSLLPLLGFPVMKQRLRTLTRSLLDFPFHGLCPEREGFLLGVCGVGCLCLSMVLGFRPLQYAVQGYIGDKKKTQGTHHIVIPQFLKSLAHVPFSFQFSESFYYFI